MAVETDWLRLGLDAGIGLFSGLAGMIGGAFRAGRHGARHDQKVKEDYDGKIGALRDEMRAAMASHTQKSDDRNELLVGQFKESFEGIRRQFDDHKFTTERDFLRKGDFKDFMVEYRENTNRILDKLDELTKAKK